VAAVSFGDAGFLLGMIHSITELRQVSIRSPPGGEIKQEKYQNTARQA